MGKKTKKYKRPDPPERTYTKEGRQQADKAVSFIKSLTHTKGRWAGKPFQLLPWQEDEIIRPFFGTLMDSGLRQYRTVYVEVPKKNGKTEISAGIALKLLVADQEPGCEVYAAAADRFQASIVSSAAISMVEHNPILSQRCDVVPSQKRIVYPPSSSFLVTLSAEVYSKHGINAHAVIFDELHAQKTRDLYDTLTFGVGDAREQPVIFIITTAGHDRNSICWELHDYALRVLKHNDPDGWGWVQGAPIDDPTFLPVIYGLPEEYDWGDEDNWKEVNPSLGHILDINVLRNWHLKAKATPSLENTFRRFRLNQWVKQSVRWMNMKKWRACNLYPIKRKQLRGRSCYCGLDLSSNIDITAFISVFPPVEDSDGTYDIFCHFFIPEDNMRERIKRDGVPYDVWEREGLITATPGNVVDYRYVIQTILKWGEFVDIKEIPYDRWGATKVSQDLSDEEVTVVPFGQGFSSMSRPTKLIETLVLQKKINHGGNPILEWMADNVVIKTDAAGNIKPDKEKSTEKIDGIVGLIMGLDRASLQGDGDFHSIYEMEDMLCVELPE